MKVTFVLGAFQPAPPVGMGAVEKAWLMIAQALVRRGHSACIVSKEVPGDSTATIAGIERRDVRGYAASGNIAIDLVTDFAYARRALQHVPECDLVVASDFWFPALYSRRRRRAPLLVHVGRFPKRQMFLYKRAEAIHAPSSPVATAIASEAPYLAARTRVIGYPVDTEVFRPAPHAPAQSLLYLGRVHPEKGLELLIEAFRGVAAELPAATLAIVGPSGASEGGGGAQYLARLKQLATGLNVTFEGPIRGEERLAARLGNASAFCYPSLAERGETFGRAVLEAMACGLPCVVSGLACFTDLIADGRTGLAFDHRSPAAATALRAQLVAVLADATLARALGQAARSRAKDFSLDALAATYEAYFREVASRP